MIHKYGLNTSEPPVIATQWNYKQEVHITNNN